MAYSRSTDPLRRFNLRGPAVGAGTIGSTQTTSMWTTLWTWLAASAAAAVILGLAFGYNRSALVHNHPGEPVTAGAAPSSAPLPAGLGDAHAPTVPATGQ
jgi:hypothetical protein